MGLIFLPLLFKGALGMDLHGETAILNDYAALGMLIFTIGIFSIASTQKRLLINIAASIASTVFSGTIYWETYKFNTEGLPANGLLVAGVLALTFGVSGGLICLLYLKHKDEGNL